MAQTLFDTAFAPLAEELRELLGAGQAIIDAHTHLGLDEDGHTLDLASLIAHLDLLGPGAQAVVFPLHDPERTPAYRVPNDRVLGWAGESDGRLFPFCRLNPRETPVEEAERCLALGARGIKLHPRAQAFGFDDPAAVGIFETARAAGVPILIHAGRGMPPMDSLADLALSFPEVPLVLAHAAIADQGMFATRFADHPAVVYDTSCAPLDLVELFARVPAERIVFASDVPYGRSAASLYQAMRAAVYAGLSPAEREMIAGGTMRALLEGTPLPAPTPPRLAEVRPTSGRLSRVVSYLAMALAAIRAVPGPVLDPARALPGVALARAVCRDPAPGAVAAALARIDPLLAAAEQLIAQGGPAGLQSFGLIASASTIATTEPLDAAVRLA